jgi:hypothetical protein
MNIVQLHERVRFWTDTVGSARFELEDIDQAINNSSNEIIDEKYDASRLNHRGDSFQRSQRVRDELSNLVKPLDTDGTLTLTKNDGSVLVSTFPSDYRYLLAISITVNSVTHNCWPLTYDRKNVIESNPFRRVRQYPNVKCYYNEDTNGINVYHPFPTSDPEKVSIEYLATPADVDYGEEFVPTDNELFYSGNLIAGATPTITLSGVTYKLGDVFSANGISTLISYGIIVANYVNPGINKSLHEELAKRAAANCLLSAGDFEKYKTFKAEVLAL